MVIMMTSLRKIQNILTRGDNPYIDISNRDKVLLHYVEEIGELVKEVRKYIITPEYKRDFGKIIKELGDNQILLCFVASALKTDLETATKIKIRENIREGKFTPQLCPDIEELEIDKII